jgi:hypothetical protein
VVLGVAAGGPTAAERGAAEEVGGVGDADGIADAGAGAGVVGATDGCVVGAGVIGVVAAGRGAAALAAGAVVAVVSMRVSESWPVATDSRLQPKRAAAPEIRARLRMDMVLLSSAPGGASVRGLHVAPAAQQ